MEISTNEASTEQHAQSQAAAGRDEAKDLRQQADDLAGLAKVKAKEAAHSGQTMAADQLQHIAQGVRRSAGNFDEEQAWIRQGLSTAAEGIERLSSSLRDRDLNDLMHEAEDTARRHPVVFATACAIAGFALMRFLKSSERESSHPSGVGGYRRHDPYGGDMARSRAASSTDPAAHVQ